MVGGADPNSIEWDDINARNMVAEVSIPKPMSYSPSGEVDILGSTRLAPQPAPPPRGAALVCVSCHGTTT